jgi:hypothetical protein
MAKASRVAARTAVTLSQLAEDVTRLEEKLDRALELLEALSANPKRRVAKGREAKTS